MARKLSGALNNDFCVPAACVKTKNINKNTTTNKYTYTNKFTYI